MKTTITDQMFPMDRLVIDNEGTTGPDALYLTFIREQPDESAIHVTSLDFDGACAALRALSEFINAHPEMKRLRNGV